MNWMNRIAINRILICTGLVTAIMMTTGLLMQAVAGETVTLTGERLEAFRWGMHQAVDDVEQECVQRGRFEVRVGDVTRVYRCQPDWI